MRYILASMLLVSGYLHAQIAHDLEVYSEDGNAFTLFLNGRQINDEPSVNVRIENIQQDQVSAKVEFEDSSIPVINQKFFQIGEPGIESSAPQFTVYGIVLTRKRGYKLRLKSMDNKKIQQEKVIIINN